MLNDLASADPLTWISICVKALVYATSLMAAGTGLFILFLRDMPSSEVRVLNWAAVWLVAAAAVLSLLLIPLRASFLMGGFWQGGTDPVILAMVFQSPLGDSIALRLFGLALILTLLIPARWSRLTVGIGAFVIAASFVLRGHALGEPRFLLSALITLHLLGLAFWIGAFLPLYRLAGTGAAADAGRLAHAFGRIAVYVVAGLVIAGGITFTLLAGNPVTALKSAYGQLFLIKLLFFVGVIGVAVWNKLHLTPALQRGDPTACAGLRRSIKWEGGLVVIVLFATATLTTVSAPLAP